MGMCCSRTESRFVSCHWADGNNHLNAPSIMRLHRTACHGTISTNKPKRARPEHLSGNVVHLDERDAGRVIRSRHDR